LDDFLSLFKKELKKSKKKDVKGLFFDLVNVWKAQKVPLMFENEHEKKEEFTFMFNDAIFRINFPSNLMIVDVNNRISYSDKELEDYMHLLRRYYNLESSVEFMKDTKTLWYLNFTCKNKDLDRMKEKLARYSNYFNVHEKDNENEIVVGIKTSVHGYSDRKIQNYKNLRKIFKLFNEESDTSNTHERK